VNSEPRDTNILSWPECARLCKSAAEDPRTTLAFRWGQTDHVLRRFFSTTALPELQTLAIVDAVWAGGPGELFLGLAARGRPLREMVVTTFVDLGRHRCVRFRVRFDGNSKPMTTYEFPKDPLHPGELELAADGLGLPRPLIPAPSRESSH